MRLATTLLIAFSLSVILTSCGAGEDNQGTEYAPNMYHSVAYEPYSQIEDWDAGRWLTSIEYPIRVTKRKVMQNFIIPTRSIRIDMNMREPAGNTVREINTVGFLTVLVKIV